MKIMQVEEFREKEAAGACTMKAHQMVRALVM